MAPIGWFFLRREVLPTKESTTKMSSSGRYHCVDDERRLLCYHYTASPRSLTILILIMTTIGISSAFISPRPPKSQQTNIRTISQDARIRGKIRPSRRKETLLLVSIESTVESDEQTLHQKPTDDEYNITSDGILLSKDNLSIESSVVESTLPTELVNIPHNGEEDTAELVDSMVTIEEKVVDVELTQVLAAAQDEVDLLQLHEQQPHILCSPSIPISYDTNGNIQADVTLNFATGALLTNEIMAVEQADVVVQSNDSQENNDYPAIIKFLFDKDDKGQTLASKLFNVALLAASFGYVFVSVFTIDRGMTRGWTAGEIGMRIPLDTWASYENSLSEKPISTKTIINIVIYLLGDWLSQTLFCGKNILDFDAGRTLKNGFIGMCFGPAVHEYYEFSDYILPVEGVTFGLTNRAFKILMDQTIYLSIKCSIYILAIGVLSGDSVEDSSENVKNRIKPIMFTAWKFWPLVHCVTYGLIPARHRILWVNSVDLVWNAILASKARADGDEEDASDEGELNGEVTDVMEDASGGGGLDNILRKMGLVLDSSAEGGAADNTNTGTSS